jgi:hypothetical protein
VDHAAPSRLPGALLISAICLVGICGLPSSLFFSAMIAANALAPDAAAVPIEIVALSVPALIAYPIAVWLWRRALRARSTGRAWLTAALGLVLVLGSSVLPVTIIGKAIAEEWAETQPGGRGYVASAGPGFTVRSGSR